MNVTVFGGAKPVPGDPAYQEAYRLGELLAKAGYTVLTGGYIGTMEAVSRGAAEAGGHVIGITCEEIENWRPTRANPWVREERRFVTLRERLFALIDHSEAAIALPGGAGTLAEISLVWNQLIIQSLAPRPLILVGSGWREVFQNLFESQAAYINERERAWLVFAATVEDAFQKLSTLSAQDPVLR